MVCLQADQEGVQEQRDSCDRPVPRLWHHSRTTSSEDRWEVGDESMSRYIGSALQTFNLRGEVAFLDGWVRVILHPFTWGLGSWKDCMFGMAGGFRFGPITIEGGWEEYTL